VSRRGATDSKRQEEREATRREGKKKDQQKEEGAIGEWCIRNEKRGFETGKKKEKGRKRRKEDPSKGKKAGLPRYQRKFPKKL